MKISKEKLMEIKAKLEKDATIGVGTDDPEGVVAYLGDFVNMIIEAAEEV